MKSKQIKSLAIQIGNLTAEKNEAYGNSFERAGDILKQLYPDGVKPDQYQDMLSIVRIIDKLFRIATRKDAFGESPYKDIAGYGLLGAVNDETNKDMLTILNINKDKSEEKENVK